MQLVQQHSTLVYQINVLARLFNSEIPPPSTRFLIDKARLFIFIEIPPPARLFDRARLFDTQEYLLNFPLIHFIK